jgi:hypothetical protein
MSNLLSGANLALALGVNKAIISLAKKAGHINHNSDGLYDIINQKNKFWIDGQISKGKVFDIGRVINKQFEPKKIKEKPFIVEDTSIEQPTKRSKHKQEVEENEVDDNVSGSLQKSKLKLEIKKLKNNDRLETLKIAKIEGELLPVNSVENIFLWAAENFRKTYEQDMDNMINIFIKKLGGQQKDFIEMKKLAMESLSITGNSLKENLIDGLKNAIGEYSDVRGRGERK